MTTEDQRSASAGTEDYAQAWRDTPRDGDPSSSNTKARKALFGAWLGFFVDLFDIYLPIVVMAPAIGYFVSDDLGTTGKAIVSGAMFAATLVGRPIGAAIFGWIADTVGRKRTTMIAMTGAGIATFLIALLPGYSQIGVTSVILFVALRFLAGGFLGGEYTGANPLAMEAAPPHKRGLYSGLINTGFPLGYAAASIITLVLLLNMPSDGNDSAYAQWGWRIPFVIGALLSLGSAWYFHKSVTESDVFTKTERTMSPFRELLQRDNAKRFLQVFVLMNGFWLALQPVAASLPALLGSDGVGLSSTSVTLTLIIAYLILTPIDVGAAVVSQRIGRRRFLIIAASAMAVAGTALFLSIVRSEADDLTWVVFATILLVIVVICPWAVLPAYINERFPTSVRASGYGLAYSLAVVIPSFYAFYQAGLANFMAFDDTGAVLLVVGSLLVLAGALFGPETRNVDLESKGLDQH
ncbi:MFS transporter [Gordonia sp. HY002]|uniref:MFS transporter n=1 Tax=Gordonia zhenghanii TaxID=2911516 RepID=UPI001EEFEDB0|nr:MFS transporter [Gordonia zhenghanii]MCF8570382.1 MFS transporter [Gordonia zhenghanii]MCF8604612.1 MFS transporter [Gordonia zhenghanii]